MTTVCSACSCPVPLGVGHACTNQYAGLFRGGEVFVNVDTSIADAPAPLGVRTGLDKIRQRRTEKQEEYADYERHHAMRVRESDLHGMWDCAVNMAEVSNYLDALDFALEALGEKP